MDFIIQSGHSLFPADKCLDGILFFLEIPSQ